MRLIYILKNLSLTIQSKIPARTQVYQIISYVERAVVYSLNDKAKNIEELKNIFFLKIFQIGGEYGVKDKKNQSENENLAKWVVSIPLNSSILTFGSRGFA